MRLSLPRTVGAKIGSTIAVVLVASALSIAAGVEGLRQVAVPLENLVQVNSVKSDAVADMRYAIAARADTVRNIALTSEVNKMQADQAEIVRLAKLYADRLATIEALPLDPQERALIDSAKKFEAQSAKFMQEALAMARALQPEVAAETLVGKLAPVQKAWLGELQALSTLEAQARAALLDAAQSARNRAMFMMLAGGTAATLFGIVAAVLLARAIVRRLRVAIGAADRIARGDLTMPIDASGHDEVAALLRAVAAMQQQLLETVAGIQQSADSIRTASSEIANGSMDLSQRTEQQAASLQEAAASMAQMTQNVQTNADHAQRANVAAVEASEIATRGGAAVAQVVATMADIQTSSRRIADIIGVIDGIAFQTNILALNAAVEAARAGEQGRGFAVVAAEVRTLAQRSAGAAREIKSLIAASVERADAGNAQVGDAGATIAKVVEQVRNVTSLIAQISSASHEQTAAIAQISTAVTQLDSMTQQNAALVEQSSGAAESLKDQTGRLTDAVEVFQIA
jgi:methyl-accepting chemotaxis protein